MLKKAKDAGNSTEIEYWDKRQLVKKINLNSLYGAILNPGCRFFDKRIGQSTTLTGPTIVKHMSAEVNKVITGKYDLVGDAMIYGDTDSCYFSGYPVLKEQIDKGEIPWDKDNVIKLYDPSLRSGPRNVSNPVRGIHCSKNTFRCYCPGKRDCCRKRTIHYKEKICGIGI